METRLSVWKRLTNRIGWLCVAALFVFLVVPPRAQAQFGAELAVIMEGLKKISSLLTSSVATPLKQIQSVEQDVQKFQQAVMYPLQAINQAKALSASFTAPMKMMQSLMNMKFSSATMAAPQQLEQTMFSANVGNIGSVGTNYYQVYGTLPAATAAPPSVRSMIDMTDAQAQDAMKKAIALDALATRELEVAQSLNQQIQVSAPGTAPILEAEASAWVLQGNAYSQSALAALLRVKSTELSNAGSNMKNATTQSQQLHSNILGVITPK
jgi:hypothetical protein